MDGREIILPQCRLTVSGSDAAEAVGFVTAGGRKPAVAWLQSAAGGCSGDIYCADAGAACCLEAGLRPKLLFGDGDSASEDVYTALAELGTVIKRFEPEKDDTDLQLLLKNIKGSIIVSGVWGGRFDHLYSNVFSLLSYKKQHQCSVVLADEKEVMVLLSADEKVYIELQDLQKVKAVSLLPLTQETRVNLSGVYWPLKEGVLQLLYPYAVSNIPLENFRCECLQGDVGLYICFEE